MYHDIGNSDGSVTSIELFEKEMKYLHDNNFHALTISDLSYNENGNYLYVKDVALEPMLPGENVTTPVVEPTENITTNITAPAEVPPVNATANVTAPTPAEVPPVNATANVTAPTPAEVPPVNATANVTAPTPAEVPPVNATANVTGPLTPESNQTLDIVKKALGIP
jgi:hypothetical protein